MDVLGEVPSSVKMRYLVEYLDVAKMGTYNQNPRMDTQKYELEYDDGNHDCYFSNVIAENLYSKVDSEGHQ